MEFVKTLDRNLLLRRRGKCVYYGSIGHELMSFTIGGLVRYISRLTISVPTVYFRPFDANPAEWKLGALGAGL